MNLVTAATMREIDRATIQDFAVPGVILMEHAGRGVADAAQRMLAERPGRRVLVLCGTGNNGGDGFVAARILADRGFDVTLALLGRSDSLQGDAALHWRPLAAFPVAIHQAPDVLPDGLLTPPGPDLIIDAILGTGLTRPTDGLIAQVVGAANALPCLRLAVDLPTGVDADRGRLMGTAFRAHRTVTFGLPKVGHFVHPAAGFCGQVSVVDIGIPRAVADAAAGVRLLDDTSLRAGFAPRHADSCKNRFGHLLVLGGLLGKSGAGLLAATAAMRAGAGLVTLATDARAADAIEGRIPDLMIERPLGSEGGHLHVDRDRLRAVTAGKSGLVVGPGLSTAPGGVDLLRHVLASDLPAVLDADALNLLAQAPPGDRLTHADCVLTPHPGEAARLLGTGSDTVQADRPDALQRLVAQSGAVVVLKGAGTLIGAPDGRVAVACNGGPALATAGSGDVLAGLIGALVARAVPPFEAACAAVHLHGLAGDLGTRRFTEHGLTASDLVTLVPEVLADALRPAGAAVAR